MKPETLAKLQRKIGDVPDHSLIQFFTVVLDEMRKRDIMQEHTQRLNGFWISKDCGPTLEP